MKKSVFYNMLARLLILLYIWSWQEIRFLKADIGQTRMYLKQKELSLQENMLSAVCANAVSVVRI
jgi:hypothetical protein